MTFQVSYLESAQLIVRDGECAGFRYSNQNRRTKDTSEDDWSTFHIRGNGTSWPESGKIKNKNIKSARRIFRPVNVHRGNLQRVYLSLPCFTRTAADEMCVNFAKDFQAIGLFKVFQVRAGAHPAFSRRTNLEINHRHGENGQLLKSETFPLQRNMCDVRRKQTNSAYVRGRNEIHECHWPNETIGSHIWKSCCPRILN